MCLGMNLLACIDIGISKILSTCIVIDIGISKTQITLHWYQYEFLIHHMYHYHYGLEPSVMNQYWYESSAHIGIRTHKSVFVQYY